MFQVVAANEEMVVVGEDAPSGGFFGKAAEQLLAEHRHSIRGVADDVLVFEASCCEVVMNGSSSVVGRSMPRATELLTVSEKVGPLSRGEGAPLIGHGDGWGFGFRLVGIVLS